MQISFFIILNEQFVSYHVEEQLSLMFIIYGVFNKLVGKTLAGLTDNHFCGTDPNKSHSIIILGSGGSA